MAPAAAADPASATTIVSPRSVPPTLNTPSTSDAASNARRSSVSHFIALASSMNQPQA
jgi:hypothetical protein